MQSIIKLLTLSLIILIPIEILSAIDIPDSGIVLYHYTGKILRDSKWGPLTRFQAALSAKLQACGYEGITADGKFGRSTQNALFNLFSCAEFQDLAVPQTHVLYGAVHSGIWRRLLSTVEIPSVHQRAFALLLTHEATDYDQVEWNYGTADDKSALTWGPFGATIGWGNEVRAILKSIDSESLSTIFGTEYSLVEEIITKDSDESYDILKVVYLDSTRRRTWKQNLQNLGRTEAGRRAYDAFAFQTDFWIKPNIKMLYRLIPEADSSATEIDYAFFLDLGTQVTVSLQRIQGAGEATAAEERQLGRPLKSYERRRVIGQYFASKVNPVFKSDRVGRNVVFYIDGLGEGNLTREELTAWRNRTGRSAANYGLSDDRFYYPVFLGE